MVPFSLYRTGVHSVSEDSHLPRKIKNFLRYASKPTFALPSFGIPGG